MLFLKLHSIWATWIMLPTCFPAGPRWSLYGEVQVNKFEHVQVYLGSLYGGEELESSSEQVRTGLYVVTWGPPQQTWLKYYLPPTWMAGGNNTWKMSSKSAKIDTMSSLLKEYIVKPYKKWIDEVTILVLLWRPKLALIYSFLEQ